MRTAQRCLCPILSDRSVGRLRRAGLLAEGEGPGAAVPELKLAPLQSDSKGEPRCLLSVVDRTVEVQAENNLRAEMLRDSLTGLPNRLSFTETVEARGAEPRVT